MNFFEEAALLMGIIKDQPLFPKQPHIVACALRRLNEIETEAKAESEKVAEAERKEAAKAGMKVVPGQPVKPERPVFPKDSQPKPDEEEPVRRI